MRSRNLTFEQQGQILYLYENNISISEIASFYHKDLSTIHRLITKLKGKRKKIKDLLQDII